MAKNSITDRIKITKKGKIKRRAMALGHSRASKSGLQLLRKKGMRNLHIAGKNIARLARS